MAQIVPLTCDPNQSFAATLMVDGANITLNLALNYNEIAGYWVMSIADSRNNPLVASVPLLCGAYPAANLLAQQAYLKIGSCYVINATNDPGDHPDNTNLGSSFVLLWDDSPLY
jgi:hypothetical protein